MLTENPARVQCITGGMDCSLVFWDYMSGRPKHAVDTGSLKSDGVWRWCHAWGSARKSDVFLVLIRAELQPDHHRYTAYSIAGAGPLINPPMVNDVCASEDGRFVACALGDCSAAVFTEKGTLSRSSCVFG